MEVSRKLFLSVKAALHHGFKDFFLDELILATHQKNNNDSYYK
jgi:hypothetical protein